MDNDIKENKTKKKLSIVTKIFLVLSLTLCICALLYYSSLKINHGIFDGDLKRIRGPHPFASFIVEISLIAGMICCGICLLFFLIPLIHSFFSGAIAKNLIAIFAGITIASFSAAFLLWTYENWRDSSVRWSSRDIDGLYKVILKYAEEHNGFLPPPNESYDKVTGTYADRSKIPVTFFDLRSIRYGVNLNLEGFRLKEIPPDVIFIFETTSIVDTTTYANQLSSESHNGKGCLVLYGDLHLEFIKTQDFNKVRWQP